MFRLRRYLPRLGRWPRLLLAGCCVLLALASAVNGKPASSHSVARTVPVVVAAADLPAGHLLVRHDLTVARWPATLGVAAVRGDPAGLIGRRLAGPVGAGEAITGPRLIGRDLAAGLPRRLVAAAITLGDEHAVELVRPGDRVDLLETEQPLDPLVAGPTRSTGSSDVADLATGVSVLAVLPASTSSDAELVVAVDRLTAVRITRDSSTHVFTAVVVPP